VVKGKEKGRTDLGRGPNVVKRNKGQRSECTVLTEMTIREKGSPQEKGGGWAGLGGGGKTLFVLKKKADLPFGIHVG